jgi:hypothetical protein
MQENRTPFVAKRPWTPPWRKNAGNHPGGIDSAVSLASSKGEFVVRMRVGVFSPMPSPFT